MPKKKISYSAYSVFRTCPFQYKLKYIDKNWYEGGIYTAFGSALHAHYELAIEGKESPGIMAFFKKVKSTVALLAAKSPLSTSV